MPAWVVFGFDRLSQTGRYCRQTGKKLGLRKWRALHQMAWSSRSGSTDLLKILFSGFCQKSLTNLLNFLWFLLFFACFCLSFLRCGLKERF